KSIYLLNITDSTLNAAKQLLLDSIITKDVNVNQENIILIKRHLGDNIKIIVDLNCFADSTFLSTHPDAKYIEATGKADNMGSICPTHPLRRDYIKEQAAKLLTLDINGIWLS